MRLQRWRKEWIRGLHAAVLAAGWVVLGLPATSLATDADQQLRPPHRELLRQIFPDAKNPFARKPDGNETVWRIEDGGREIGAFVSTWEATRSVGYSGQALDIAIGLTQDARIAGAALVRHSEPVLTLGISDADIQAYIRGFIGYDLRKPRIDAFSDAAHLPPIIARATVSTGVIRDAILRSARIAALTAGYIKAAGNEIDRTVFELRSWAELIDDGSIARATVTMGEARDRFGLLANPLPPDSGPFMDLWVAIADPPTIGKNLLGEKAYTRVMAAMTGGDAALLIASAGSQSHRGTHYQTTGLFERLELIQGDRTIRFQKDDYRRIDHLSVRDHPELREVSLFRIPQGSGFRAAEPFHLEVTAERERPDGSLASFALRVPYALPERYKTAPNHLLDAVEEPVWMAAWRRKPIVILTVIAMILTVAIIFFAQEQFVRRPQFWQRARLAFLATTLVYLGWVANGQLSVVQVLAFFHSLLTGFKWETFLIEPVIFTLWSFVALGLLFLGRGVYCGWLCPFGALQELIHELAKKLGIKQIEVPFALQERLWTIKYTLFVGILGLSFYSMHQALLLAEIEPFKTVISLRFAREWPFVLFALALLAAGLFIERFYCRYLCPLGAALGIPAKIKLFDWLHRRPQCGRECRVCETKCTVGAIDPLGRINPNECILCLRCQVILNDPQQCTVLRRRGERPTSGARIDTANHTKGVSP